MEGQEAPGRRAPAAWRVSVLGGDQEAGSGIFTQARGGPPTALPLSRRVCIACVLDRLTRLFDDYRISQRYIESHHPCSLLIHACCCASCLHARLMLSAHAIRGIAIIVIMCCRACCFGAPPVTAHHPIHLHQVTAVRTRRNDVTFTFNRYESLHHRRPHIFAISRFIIRVCLMLLELAMMVDCSP